MAYIRVLVTGGSGFIGKNLKDVKPGWVYVSSEDYNLRNYKEADKMIKKIKPDAIVHLAAKVGGIKANAEKQVEFLEDNVLINLNVLRAAYKNGVKRVLSSLSSCAFPDHVKRYPMKEKDIFKGMPAETNLAYAYSKRLLHVQTLAYRKQYGVNYSTFVPCNIYGPCDNFDLDNGHFVAALIRKVCEAKDGDELKFWGSGKVLRQQMYVEDLCELIPLLLDEHITEAPLIVAPTDVYTIEEMIKTFLKQIDKNLTYSFNGKMLGQYKKTVSNEKLLKLIGNYPFKPFSTGIKRTYDWYCRECLNYEK